MDEKRIKTGRIEHFIKEENLIRLFPRCFGQRRSFIKVTKRPVDFGKQTRQKKAMSLVSFSCSRIAIFTMVSSFCSQGLLMQPVRPYPGYGQAFGRQEQGALPFQAGMVCTISYYYRFARSFRRLPKKRWSV
ncbi:hypothetical protein [Allobaculum sp. Allo2]|uniref:hypothetical protein n=1 Tax=Allobaculum sp. Allo2 TaxID=2853432 RepID=UPI001F62370A|nr:hypothetical protein [Allobaculum sp. Allo2]